MGIVIAVQKNNICCIAADSMTISGGCRKQTANQIVNSDKIFKYGTSYVGTTSHPAWNLALKSYFNKRKQKNSLKTKDKIFKELLLMHQELKDNYSLIPATDEEGPFESTNLETIIVNSSGIFKTYEHRSVQQFIHYTATGSGASYALGAMYALYKRLDTAEEIAREAILATVDFDDSSGLPATFYTVKLK